MRTFRNLLLFMLCIGFGSLWAQEKQNPYQLDLDKANAAFDSKKYNTAAQLFQKVYGKIKDQELKQKVLFKIADSYRYSNNFKQALKWYEDVLNSKYPDPTVIYSYAQLLKNFERYEEAGRAFYDYSFENPDDIKGKEAQRSCAIAAVWKENPLKFKVENLKELNSDASDYSPYFSKDKLYFTSARKEAQGKEIFEWTGQKYCDLFESNIAPKGYSKPTAIKGLNSDFNEGVAWLDSTATQIFFTQCNGVDGKGISCKIYRSFVKDGNWVQPQALPFNSDSFSMGHPAFNPEGTRMYFSSDMPGGFGKKDIWFMSYNALNDKWGEPVNLGKNVNSTEDDMFPYVGEEGSIYYSSKGFVGMGGLDLFKTADSAGTFKMAENLKYPINSGGDDFGITFLPKNKQADDKPIAWISSNREGGLGDDDLYSVSIKPFILLLKGIVLERESNQPLGSANLNISLLPEGTLVQKARSNEKGQFTGDLPANHLIGIQASKDKYLTSSLLTVDTRGIKSDTLIELVFYMDKVPNEDVEITLQGIYYDLDKWAIRPDAAKILDSMAVILKNNPTLVIELASHTDSRAPADYNLDLSKKRAQSCVNYLVQKGIGKDRMVPVGYGETKLVNDCTDGVDCTEEEHQQNRRTTVRVLRTDFKSKK